MNDEHLIHFPWYCHQYMGMLTEYSFLERGAFITLLSYSITKDGVLPEGEGLFRMCGAFTKDEQESLLKVAEKVTEISKQILAKQKDLKKKRKAAGKKGAQATNSKFTTTASVEDLPQQTSGKEGSKIPSNTETETETEQEIETDTETTKKINKKEDLDFVRFWEIYPTGRKGAKDKAASAFLNALGRHKKDGLTAEQIVFAATVYAKSNEGTGPYVKGAAAWLNDDRFLIDYAVLDAKQPQRFNKANSLVSPAGKYDVE